MPDVWKKKVAMFFKYRTWLFDGLLPWFIWHWAVRHLEEVYESRPKL